jgi:predicted metal-dependent hydrolase
MNIDTIRVFAITKLAWIRQQQKKLREQNRETPREYLDRESYYFWGKRYLLKVTEHDAALKTELNHNKIHLQVRPATSHRSESRPSLKSGIAR